MYRIKEAVENSCWAIYNEKEIAISVIRKSDIIAHCVDVCDEFYVEYISADKMTELVWDRALDDYDLKLVDPDCQDWDKFTAWFNYICVKYFTKEVVAFYGQKLLDFE